MGKPDFILIGETKCGTTSLYNYMIEHPQVLDTYGNGEGYDKEYATKELRFFDKFYSRGIDWYYSKFPEKEEGQVTGEATPMYMYRTLIAQRIKEHLPNIKLIVLLRNPVDRLISNYQHNFKWVPGWKEAYPSLQDYFMGCMDKDYYQIDKSIYYYSLLRWFDHFYQEQFHIIKSEDLYQQPKAVYQSLTKFLSIDESFQPASFPVYRANEYDLISSDLRQTLEDFYRPYNEKLESLLNRKMDWF